MKNLFYFLVTISLFSTSFACNKKNDIVPSTNQTIIEGRVIEKGSNKPVAGAKIIFSECVAGDGTFSPSTCLDVESTTTDVNGNFRFTKDADTADRYRIRAQKANYGAPVEVYQVAKAREKTTNIDFTLPAFAWIKFHVKNVKPLDDDDLIVAPGYNGGNLKYRFYGRYVDTTYILGGRGYIGNEKILTDWFVYRANSNKQLFKDSVYCKPLDTVFYEIKY